MNRSLLSLACCAATTIAALAVLCLPASAQTGKRRAVLPSVDFGKVKESPLPEDITGTTTDTGKAPLSDLNNPYLKDTLILQHQIGLLERLIERQTVISKMESAYAQIGLPFHSPPPPKEICDQLPPSIPCTRGNANLSGASLTDISIDMKDLLPKETPTGKTPPTTTTKAATTREKSSALAQEQEPAPYNWTDISCAGTNCKAVLVKTDDPASRITVSTGDVLPDKSIVSTISFEGVTLSVNGKKILLEAAKAPSRGGPSSSVLDALSTQTSTPAQSQPETPPEAKTTPNTKTSATPQAPSMGSNAAQPTRITHPLFTPAAPATTSPAK